MKLIDRFKQIFSATEREVETLTHLIEKELKMALPQNIVDALDRIKALISNSSSQNAADQQTISNLNSQVADLTSQGQAKDAQITDLTQQLSDATSQLTDVENQLLAISPPPAA